MDIEENVRQINFMDKKSVEDDFPHDLQKMIKSVIKKEGFITYNVQKKKITTDGGNYLGVLYEIDVKGMTANGEKETNIFIKQIISSDQMKIISINDAYVRESYAYRELFKTYKELQDEANVPAEERLKTPKCYDETNNHAIVLENLARKGFKTCHRRDVVSLKFAELAIEQLAKFHGLSMALQKRRPEYFEKKIKSINNPFSLNDNWETFVRNMCEITARNLNNDSMKKMKPFVQIFLDKYPKHIGDNTSLGCCLCHGDYRANNILMKETNGEVTKVIPVDYQLLYYGSPLNDFLYFIFTCTDQEFRRKHLNHLKNFYYESLSGFLKYFDMDLNTIYPRKEFERQYEEKLDFGLMSSIYVIPFCFVDEDNVPDLSKDDLASIDFKLDEKFAERIRGIVDDFIEWGYL